MNIIINSEMRVGSRWIHFLLSDILDMGRAPELDQSKLKTHTEQINTYFTQNRIVKVHHATPTQLEELDIENCKIIGIVRNPRDRIVSRTFHARYKSPGLKRLKQAKSDTEAVKLFFNDSGAQNNNKRQFTLMKDGYSTQSYQGRVLKIRSLGSKFLAAQREETQNYIWTAYEWLQDDIFEEISTILEFLGVHKSDKEIKNYIEQHSFKNKSGRKKGNEDRQNEWRRKGVNKDYKNWFTDEMLKKSKKMYEKYKTILKKEGKSVLTDS